MSSFVDEDANSRVYEGTVEKALYNLLFPRLEFIIMTFMNVLPKVILLSKRLPALAAEACRIEFE